MASTNTPFKNILLIGPGGSLGSILLAALRKEPSLTITLLQRISSKTPLDPKLRTILVPDNYPHVDLVAAFRGHDAVVNAMSAIKFPEQKRLIDAAVEAGVKRWFASEFGLDNSRPDAQAENNLFLNKGMTRAYLQELAAADKLEWTSIACGIWIKWAMACDFLGMHVHQNKMVLYDNGNAHWTATTEENTAKAVAELLTRKVDYGRNRNVFLSDFVVSQRELLAEIERQTGTKYEVENIDSAKWIADHQAAYAAGTHTAVFGLIEAAFALGERFGANFEHSGVEISNEALGLKKYTLEDVVRISLLASKVPLRG